MGKKEDDHNRGQADGAQSGWFTQILHQALPIHSKHYDDGFQNGVLNPSRSPETKEYQEETNSVDSEYDDDDDNDYYVEEEDDEEDEDEDKPSTLKNVLQIGGAILGVGILAVGILAAEASVKKLEEEDNNND